MSDGSNAQGQASGAGRFLGSLRDALQAASRGELASSAALAGAGSASAAAKSETVAMMPPAADLPANVPDVLALPPVRPAEAPTPMPPPPLPPSAAEAARAARGSSSAAGPVRDLEPPAPARADIERPPTTRVIRATPAAAPVLVQPEVVDLDAAPRTQVLRGRQQVVRGDFRQDPVVGWLVVVGGAGLGSFRPIFEGNNSIGRSTSNRIAIDFGDEAISAEEQAYVRYDSTDRAFLFVPNLAKTNVVSVNAERPTAARPLSAMDVITIGRTQLVFVPFCGPEFDWSELSELKR